MIAPALRAASTHTRWGQPVPYALPSPRPARPSAPSTGARDAPPGRPTPSWRCRRSASRWPPRRSERPAGAGGGHHRVGRRDRGADRRRGRPRPVPAGRRRARLGPLRTRSRAPAVRAGGGAGGDAGARARGLPGRAGAGPRDRDRAVRGRLLAYEPYPALYPSRAAARRGAVAERPGRRPRRRHRPRPRRRRPAAGDRRHHPLLLAAGVLLATTGAFVGGLVRREPSLQQERRPHARARGVPARCAGCPARSPSCAISSSPTRRKAALGAIRTFVVLFVATGLGLSLLASAGVVGAAGVCVLAGAASAGVVAERFGTVRVVRATAITRRADDRAAALRRTGRCWCR